MNYLLWTVTAAMVLISLLRNKDKTFEALKLAAKKFKTVFSLFLIVMAVYSLIISYLPPELIQHHLGRDSGIHGAALALGLGSVSVMPGFAAFPLCAALKGLGIPNFILAAFSVSLMNVGIATFPIEKRFLGFKVALARNGAALLITFLTIIIFKLIFGE